MQGLRTEVPEEVTAELKVPGFWAVLDEGCIQAKLLKALSEGRG